MTRRQWELAVGAQIASRAQPIALQAGVLVIRAATSAWAHELSLLKTTLVQNLAARGIAVRDIRFRVGAIDPPLRPPPEREILRRVPAGAELPADLRVAIDAVPDDELRSAIAQAARASLGWVSGAPPGARAPRGAGKESAPPARIAEGAGAAARRMRAGERDRSR